MVRSNPQSLFTIRFLHQVLHLDRNDLSLLLNLPVSLKSHKRFLEVSELNYARYRWNDHYDDVFDSKFATNRHTSYVNLTFYLGCHLEKIHMHHIVFVRFQRLIKIYIWYDQRSILRG